METNIDHNHDGINSPKIDEDNIEDAIDKNTVVKTTTDQTVAGVKTFTSIPILPNSDPTSDNQGARKAYVDNVLASELIASTTLRDNADTQRENATTTPTKVKEIKINDVDGVITVKFRAYQGSSSGQSKARIYVNGTAKGTEQIVNSTISSPQDFSEDISISQDDLVQLYIWLDTHTGKVYAENFRLYYDKALTLTTGTVNQN